MKSEHIVTRTFCAYTEYDFYTDAEFCPEHTLIVYHVPRVWCCSSNKWQKSEKDADCACGWKFCSCYPHASGVSAQAVSASLFMLRIS